MFPPEVTSYAKPPEEAAMSVTQDYKIPTLTEAEWHEVCHGLDLRERDLEHRVEMFKALNEEELRLVTVRRLEALKSAAKKVKA
jgi:hypothetical protein